MKENLIIGDQFEGVLLETTRDEKSTRPRVRPLEYFDREINVEFPRNLRVENPVGTRFRADVKVSQKTQGNMPYGKPYLVANVSSIEILEEFKPEKSIYAIKLNTASDRSFEYIEKEFKQERRLIKFEDLRNKVYNNSIIEPERTEISSISNIKRSDLIKTYALSRARGKCEGYSNDAPFLKRNGQPYLEIHHLIELGNGGSDSPKNVIALCPNCHARVSHGLDGAKFNEDLKSRILRLEEEMGKV